MHFSCERVGCAATSNVNASNVCVQSVNLDKYVFTNNRSTDQTYTLWLYLCTIHSKEWGWCLRKINIFSCLWPAVTVVTTAAVADSECRILSFLCILYSLHLSDSVSVTLFGRACTLSISVHYIIVNLNTHVYSININRLMKKSIVYAWTLFCHSIRPKSTFFDCRRHFWILNSIVCMYIIFIYREPHRSLADYVQYVCRRLSIFEITAHRLKLFFHQ